MPENAVTVPPAASASTPRALEAAAGGAPWVRPFVTMVLMVSMAIAAYYIFYQNQKKDYLAGHSNRLLDVMATGIVRAVVTRAGGHAVAVTTPSPVARRPCVEGSDCTAVRVNLTAVSPTGVLTLEASEYPDRRVTLELGDVVDWRIFGERFDDVWIVRDGKTVLAHMNPNAPPPPRDPKFQAPVRPSVTPDEAAKATTPSLPSRVLEYFWPPQASKLQWRGEPYLAFDTPISMPSDPVHRGGIELTVESGVLKDVDLYGIVRESRFTRDALALSYRVLMTVSAMVLLAFLVLPYVKIRFMARRERLRWIDFWLLGISGLVAAQVGVFGIVVMAWHGVMTPRLDQALGRYADEIAAHLTEELDAARWELDADVPVLRTGSVTQGSVFRERPEIGRRYGYFEALFYADANGWQQSKWMPWTLATDRVSIGTEPYFRAARQAAADPGFPIVFASTDAPNSGKQLAVLARPVSAKPDDGVAVLASEMLSLTDVVGPYPLEYVLLDDEGKVLFRSRPGPNPRENFLSEMDWSADLYARVSGARTWFDSQYLGRTHRMHVSPLALPGAPRLTILTFYDRAFLDTLMFEATIASFVWIIIGGLAVVVALVIARIFFGPWSNEWLWPCEHRSAMYVLATGLLVAAGCLFVFHAYRHGVGWLTVSGPGIIMLLASLPRVHRLAGRTTELVPGAELRAQRWYPYTYLAFMTALLLCTGAVPAGLIATEAFRAHVEAFARVTEGRWASALEARYAKIRALYVSADPDPKARKWIPVPDNREGAFEQCRLAQTWDLYTPVLAERIVASPPWQRQLPACASPRTTRRMERHAAFARAAELPSCGLEFVATPLPAGRSPLAALAAACLPETGSDGLDLRVHLVTPDAPISAAPPAFHTWASAAGGALWPVPHTRLPALGDLNWKGIGIYVVLPGLVVVVIAWLVTRSVATDIMGLDLEGDGIVDEGATFASMVPFRAGEGRWLLLRPPPHVRAFFTLRDARGNVDLAEAGAPVPAEDALADAWVIRNVHAKLPDAAWRKAILARMAAALDAPLVLTSDIDPIYWLASRPSARNGAVDDGELARWSAAVETFRKWRFKLSTDAEADSTSSAAAGVVAEECQWTIELVAIAMGLDMNLLETMSASRIVEHIGDHAEPYYRRVWSLCSEDEKLVLVQLAEEGLVNPRHFDVLRRLRRRHLVRTRGQIRIMNESFARFVREAEEPSTVTQWESPVPGTGSARVRLPLLAVATVCGALLLFTQQHLFDSLLGVAGAAIGALGTVSGLASSFRKHVIQS